MELIINVQGIDELLLMKEQYNDQRILRCSLVQKQ